MKKTKQSTKPNWRRTKRRFRSSREDTLRGGRIMSLLKEKNAALNKKSTQENENQNNINP
jgi:hypothetical protein